MLAARCPWCETVFRLTKEQAALRAGMARCGVCSHTFNALDYLVRGNDVASNPSRPRELPKPIRNSPFSSPFNAPSSAPFNDPFDDLFRDHLDARLDGNLDARLDDDLGELVEVERQAPEPYPVIPPERPEPKLSPRAEARSPSEEDKAEPNLGRRVDDLPDDGERHLSEPSFLRSARGEEDENLRGANWGWGLLSLVTLVALAAQALFVWRSEVVVRFPSLRPAYEQACVLMRCRIEPPADIAQIAIESSALEAVPGNKDAMTFSALLRNHSTLAGRYPAIELTLTDAQDRPMIRRVLQSGEYLSAADRNHYVQGLPANSELPVKIVFEVAGGGVAGYRVAVFYP